MSYEPRVYGIGEASMYCSNCGAQNNESTTRCSNCGSTLQRIETPTVDVPPPRQMAGGSIPGGSASAVPNRLVGAIVLTILNFVLAFFTFITGLGVITSIIAIVFAAQVNGKLNRGDYAGAVEASKVARILN
jgi:Interferon-induced transmembrane protein/zinc-ribbon domain